ncbi:P-loop containing nucleoside triphosphate hydrolase protein [Penicillium capsulatum]|uniref:P-loop containing nucleoside triphosphate hydrolase protein n=1 Tax=Penicillium capsulatum TaxID=69766 RepID=A0A9W9LZ50_9EURO|nr:P-loop containing nucleoside triphosphate hydrolase protein [Penicillium capsulatum]KAJ6129821.1 P-loop containing nucleoside triphosphate hydrolase protein [Penicillium capsulatum]
MLDPPAPCSVLDEDVFGPFVNASCRHGFDFTLLFEESVMTLLPLAAVLSILHFRVWKLQRASDKVNRSWLYVAKETSYAIYIALQFALAILWSQPATPKTRATMPTAIFGLATSLVFLYVSHLEHIRSLRPSTILCLALGLTLIFDLARLRTLSFMPANGMVTALFAVGVIIKAITLILESMEKRSLLKKPYENSSIETTSGVFSRSLFWWLNDLLVKGSKTTLTVDSLPALDEELKEAANPQSLREKWAAADHYRSNALLWTFIAHYKWPFMAGVLPRMAYTGFTFAQPFLVERVLNFMTEPEHVNSTNYAYGLIGAYAIVYVGIAVSYAVYQHKIFRLITMVRGSLVTLIFEKTLRMSTSAVADASAITLMSTDIDRIAHGLLDMHEIYMNLIEVVLVLWLLARLLHLAVIASTAIVLVCLIAGIPLAIACGNAQGIWLEAVAERVAVTSKVLGVIKNIKMTGLTDIVANIVRDLRSDEIEASFSPRIYTVFRVTLSYASSVLAPVFGFGLYIILAHTRDTTTLTNAMAFSALTLFSLLDNPMVSLVDDSEDFAKIVNCFQRIQKHLLESERVDFRLTHDPPTPTLIDVGPVAEQNKEVSAMVRNLSVAWSVDDEPVVKNVSFDVMTRKTTMVVGPVGCGKSTLLRALLGESPEYSGTISTTYRNEAYCSQAPWITFGTVQQNIVGGSQWDRNWYDRVVQACALQPDLQQLPAGDQTKVGVRGSRLSGGQQIRVALARALYSRETVLVLDDVLTGLDRETEKCILESVFASGGLVKQLSQTVILATNSAHHLPYTDFVIALDKTGRIIEQGSYVDLVAAKGYVSTLTSVSHMVNTTRAPNVILDEDTIQELNLDEEEVDLASRKTGDWSVYVYYFRTIGWPLLFTFFICSALFVFGLIFPQIWLQAWTRANEKYPNQDIGYWLGGYTSLGVLSLVTTFLANWVLIMLIVPKTARKFHEVLLSTTMRAKTSYLTSTDVGTTTNRFSQDLELIDEDLPEAFELATNGAISCVAEGFLVFAGSSYLTMVAIPFCIAVIYYVAKFYVRTSRQLRLLEIEAKAPLFSQFLEALSDLPSIRAYGWTNHYKNRNQIALGDSQRPHYMLYCIQRWLHLVLDLIVAAIAVIVIAVATSLRGDSALSLLGIALFNIVSFSGTLQMLVTEWIGLETSIGAVSRIRSYVNHAKTEHQETESESAVESWPEHGAIEIAAVSASYDQSSDPVLQDISLSICPGEKVALCGRTGSGKSSLISTILRTLDLDAGMILIDGVDISRIPRSQVRSRLNTVSQQPFFLHGTVRLNVNPEGNVADSVIIDALNTVNLWSHIESKGGLDEDMSEEMLSHGQQQLFCLARALCKTSQILILDEATSSVDSETDKLMQQVIRTHFQSQTIIAIAHKLDTVLDYDRIVFLDHGQVVESDAPQNLLSREGSAFRMMYDSFRRSAA